MQCVNWTHARTPSNPLFQHWVELGDNQSGYWKLSLWSIQPTWECPLLLMFEDYYLVLNSYDLESYHSGTNVVHHVKSRPLTI